MNTTALLGELCEIQSGGTPRREHKEFYGGPIPWAKISDLAGPDLPITATEESLTPAGLAAIGGRLFPQGTVLLAMYGSVGDVGIAGVPLSTNQAILGLQPRVGSALDSSYLVWWLESSKSSLIRGARGVTQKNLSAEYVRDLAILLPPIHEQQRIATILTKVGKAREKRRESLRLLDQFLQSAFRSMIPKA